MHIVNKQFFCVLLHINVMYVYVDIIYLIMLHMHLCSVFIKISFHANTSLHTDYDRQLCLQAVDKYKEKADYLHKAQVVCFWINELLCTLFCIVVFFFLCLAVV